PDQPAVGLELGFARTAGADAAGLALEMLPQAGQAGQGVLKLRELDLESRLASARAPGEDVEDQLGAVDHLAVERLLEVAHLRRRQIVVEDHEIGVPLRRERLELLDLALADERGRMHPAPAL